MSDERQRIIASVFSRRNAQGSLEESYVSHVKIWEDAEGGKKLRFILLSQASNGAGYIHKSKLNSNGTFSVGKTWMLHELRIIHVLSNISMADRQLHRATQFLIRPYSPLPPRDSGHTTSTAGGDFGASP
jgi:hypothetical protein